MDYVENASSAVAVVDSNNESALVVAAPPPPPPKTSTLPEPTVACVGHGASVTSLDFVVLPIDYAVVASTNQF